MRAAALALVVGLVCAHGCAMVEVGVVNPVPGMTTVAVAPFFNVSSERMVDGRRFANAYFAELQKTPGFQVVPEGIVERAMQENRLELGNPDDALKLCELLGADAIVIGAVTDYSPYYPPRIGLQVSWYSPRPWTFYPGVPTDDFARDIAKPNRWRKKGVGHHGGTGEMSWHSGGGWLSGWFGTKPEPVQLDTRCIRGQSPAVSTTTPPTATTTVPGTSVPEMAPADFDPRQPLMSYTRMFDGADPRLTARLRDYVELGGDLRAGGWQAYLQRSDDFIRFTAHLMIVEMLQLHGGEARKRFVIKHRNYR